MSDEATKAQPQAASKSRLNPFAREFKLNVNAPSFTPGGQPAKPPGSALPVDGAGQGAGPASTPSLPPSQPSTGLRSGSVPQLTRVLECTAAVLRRSPLSVELQQGSCALLWLICAATTLLAVLLAPLALADRQTCMSQ